MGADTVSADGLKVGAAMKDKEGLKEGAPTLKLTAETEVTTPPGRPMAEVPAPGAATFPERTIA